MTSTLVPGGSVAPVRPARSGAPATTPRSGAVAARESSIPTPTSEPPWTTVGVGRREGRLAADLRRGALVPYALDGDDRTLRVALVAGGALLLGDDHVRVRVRVGAGAVLELVETSGTVAYDGRGRPARWEVEAVVEPGGVLVWDAQPFVVATGADVHRSTSVRLGEGAVACLRETLVLGRSGERGGRLRTSLRVNGPDGPMLHEELRLDGGRPEPGVLGTHRVVDSVVLVGRRPGGPVDGGAPVPAAPGNRSVTVLHLEEPGAVARRTGVEAHRVVLTEVAAAWCDDARGAPT